MGIIYVLWGRRVSHEDLHHQKSTKRSLTHIQSQLRFIAIKFRPDELAISLLSRLGNVEKLTYAGPFMARRSGSASSNQGPLLTLREIWKIAAEKLGKTDFQMPNVEETDRRDFARRFPSVSWLRKKLIDSQRRTRRTLGED
jgi:hypothetical protein